MSEAVHRTSASRRRSAHLLRQFVVSAHGIRQEPTPELLQSRSPCEYGGAPSPLTRYARSKKPNMS
jgi:hypothetical protein